MKTSQIIRIILIVIVGIATAYILYMSKYAFGLAESIRLVALLGIGLILFIWSVIADLFLSKNKNVKSVFRYLSVALCLVFIIVFVSIELYNKSILESKTYVKVDCNSPHPSEWHYIDFKTNGTYVYYSYIGMFDSKMILGEYTISADTITILKTSSNTSSKQKGEFVMIARDSLKSDSLYIVHKFNLIDRSSNFYNIIVDNR